MTTVTAPIDEARAEAFAGRVMETLNGAFLTLAVSVGHQAGLFDTMATLPPSSSQAIAEAAGLNERYVREWLAAVVAGGVVEYDPAARTYRLPAEHAAFLTTSAGTNNLAYFAQYVPLAGQVEAQILRCFREGGGLSYDAYERFHELQRGESTAVFDASLIDVILPLVRGLTERLEAGIDVADIGCGGGHAVNLMARAFPNSRFTGYDFAGPALAPARAEASAWGLGNSHFAEQDVAQLDVTGAFDLITAFDSIHDQADPRRVLANIARALRPGGTFLMADIAASSNLEDNLEHPLGAAMYTISYAHCMSVSLAFNGEGLGTMWGEQAARELLAEAGFRTVEVRLVEGDMFNSYYICSK